MVKVPISNSFLERRDDRRKFSESLGAGASLAPCTRQRIPLGSENDWEFRLRSCQSWNASKMSMGVVVSTYITKYRMRYVGLGRNNLRSHFVFRPGHAPEWLRGRFLPVVFLSNEEKLTGKIFTTSLNTTNPNTYVKFIFLQTSPLKGGKEYKHRTRKQSATLVWGPQGATNVADSIQEAWAGRKTTWTLRERTNYRTLSQRVIPFGICKSSLGIRKFELGSFGVSWPALHPYHAGSPRQT